MTATPASAETRGFRAAYNDAVRRSSVLRFTNTELADLLETARENRRKAQAEHGRESFEHGFARGRVALLSDELGGRGLTPEEARA